MSQSVTGVMWTKRRFVLKKICGYQILGFFWTRLKVPAKRIWINLVKLHILVARIYLPFTRKHRIRPPKPHVFETTLHSVSFFGFEGFAKSCRLSWLKPGLFYFIHSSIHFQPTPPTPSPPGFVWTRSESETNTKKRSCHSVPGGKQSTIYNR